MRRGLLIVAFLATTLGAATPALATPETDAKATKLFEEGKKQRDASNFEAAIASFSESAKYHASFGAYFNLGLCNEALGKDRPAKIHEALEWYKKAQDFAVRNNDARESDARQAIAKLRESNNYVLLQVPAAVADAPGLRVDVDGNVVPSERYNGEIFLKSSGDHEVVVNARGRKEQRLTAKNKAAITVSLGDPFIEGLPPPPPPTPTETSGGGWGWQKWTGAGVAATGLVLFTVGVVKAFWYVGPYASEQSARDAERRSYCATNPANGKLDCTQSKDPSKTAAAARSATIDANDRYNANEQEAKDRAPATIIFGAAGAVLIGVGAYLFFSAPSAESAPSATAANEGVRVRLVPQVHPRESGLSVVGTF